VLNSAPWNVDLSLCRKHPACAPGRILLGLRKRVGRCASTINPPAWSRRLPANLVETPKVFSLCSGMSPARVMAARCHESPPRNVRSPCEAGPSTRSDGGRLQPHFLLRKPLWPGQFATSCHRNELRTMVSVEFVHAGHLPLLSHPRPTSRAEKKRDPRGCLWDIFCKLLRFPRPSPACWPRDTGVFFCIPTVDGKLGIEQAKS